MKKIIMAASSGGHVEQLLCLKELNEFYECILVTEETSYKSNYWQNKKYFVPQINRKEKLFLLKCIKITAISLKIIMKEKPNAVITTGALAMIPICLISKLLGNKLIYIESFAKVNSPTKTGKFLYKFSDIFIVQWESMLKYYPKAIYGGEIY